MYSSIEVRWFFKEEPANIINWFGTMEEWPKEDNSNLGNKMKLEGAWERSDHYLNVDRYPRMSFKIREGKTEVKVLDESFGKIKFSSEIAGNVEKWIKWGASLKNPMGVPTDLFSKPEKFMEIKKERLLLKYEINAKKEVKRVDPKRVDLKNGCQVELTKIEFNSKIYYSFGFESLGEDALLMDNFTLVNGIVFKQIKDIKLTTSESYSYPQFLANEG